MKVLVIGSGGREHALLWRLAQSPSVTEVYAIPGNDGMSDVAHLIPVKGHEDILDFAKLMEVDLTVAGPETVLTEGLADEFEAQGLPFFGPSKAAARIEGSKGFAKDLMKKYGIPTAAYEVFTDEDRAVEYLKNNKKYPIVIKADGLAAGKGVIIAQNEEEAVSTVKDMLEGHSFGGAGRSVVIEEFMEGEEASVLCFCDGTHVVPMVSSQDHKRIFDNDEGPNTGGMGAYSPAPVVTPEIYQMVMDQIIYPTVRGMKEDGIVFTGFLYAGLMISKDASGKPTVKTLEFNCRFGDPETQPIMSRLKSDFSELIEAGIDGSLDKVIAKWDPRCALGVVLASKGYPTAPRKGDVISGVELQGDDTVTFHAGTKFNDKGELVTSGGRVLCVVGLGGDLHQARDKAYKALDKVHFDGMQYRKDIGHRAL